MATIYSNPRTEEYEILHDAYYGSGMFASGAAITPHRREGTDSIKFRRQIAYYLNYTGPILNASVDPIFKDEIKREYSKSVLFDEFINDRVLHYRNSLGKMQRLRNSTALCTSLLTM